MQGGGVGNLNLVQGAHEKTPDPFYFPHWPQAMASFTVPDLNVGFIAPPVRQVCTSARQEESIGRVVV